MPAIPYNPDDLSDRRILIPEKISGYEYRLVSSDPFSLIRRFEKRVALELQESLHEIDWKKGRIIAEKFPEPLEYLGVLRYVIILVKRARDNFFSNIKFGRKCGKKYIIDFISS